MDARPGHAGRARGLPTRAGWGLRPSLFELTLIFPGGLKAASTLHHAEVRCMRCFGSHATERWFWFIGEHGATQDDATQHCTALHMHMYMYIIQYV